MGHEQTALIQEENAVAAESRNETQTPRVAEFYSLLAEYSDLISESHRAPGLKAPIGLLINMCPEEVTEDNAGLFIAELQGLIASAEPLQGETEESESEEETSEPEAKPAKLEQPRPEAKKQSPTPKEVKAEPLGTASDTKTSSQTSNTRGQKPVVSSESGTNDRSALQGQPVASPEPKANANESVNDAKPGVPTKESVGRIAEPTLREDQPEIYLQDSGLASVDSGSVSVTETLIDPVQGTLEDDRPEAVWDDRQTLDLHKYGETDEPGEPLVSSPSTENAESPPAENAEQLEDVVVQLTEKIEALEGAEAEATEELLDEISVRVTELHGRFPDQAGEPETDKNLEPATEQAEIKQEVTELVRDLMKRLEVDYSPETVESVVNLILIGPSGQLIEDTKTGHPRIKDNGTHEIVKQMSLALANLQQKLLGAYHLGQSALRLYTTQHS